MKDQISDHTIDKDTCSTKTLHVKFKTSPYILGMVCEKNLKPILDGSTSFLQCIIVLEVKNFL